MLYKYQKKAVVPIRKNLVLPSQAKKEKRVALSFAIICFLSGSVLLAQSAFPYLSDMFSSEQVNKSVLSPSAGSSTNSFGNENSSLEFSSSYISNVTKSFDTTNKVLNIDPRTFPEYANIRGEMWVEIPKIDIGRVRVQINVDSFEEESYMPLLDTSLAHFKGTSLPDKEGNTFVYGHSTNEWLAKTNRNDPKFAFTFLNDLDIGDEIYLEYKGRKYTYSTQKIRRVSPEDISPIYTTSTAKTLTLMTCWPPGIGSERLIVQTILTEEELI